MQTAATQKLGIRHPIIQGPFGGNFSTVRLAATVSNLGGLGSFGLQAYGPDDIRRIVGELRSSTDKPFAVNLWVSDHDLVEPGEVRRTFSALLPHLRNFHEELKVALPELPEDRSEGFEKQMEAVLEARPPVFSFVFGIPSPDILKECRRRGIVTIGAATTVDEALAVEAAGVDMVLATGFEAGGHRPSFLKPAEDSLYGTLPLVATVVRAVKIPVIAAGGIASAEGVAAALTLGAGAVQIGTAFLACEESGAHPFHKACLLGGQCNDTTLSRAYTGRLARFVRNRFIDKMRGQHTLPFPHQSHATAVIKTSALDQGRADLAALYAGQGAPLLRHRTAAEVFRGLVG